MEEKQQQATPQMTLEDVQKLVNENRQLKALVNQLNDARGIKRLEFLFNIVENAVEFPREIVEKTVKEISSALFEEEKQEVNEEK